MNEHFIEYAPVILMVVAFVVQYKIFVTPSQLQDVIDEKLDKYLLKEVYQNSHNRLCEQMDKFDTKLEDLKNLLIQALQEKR